jgi:hypothetical protein
MAWTQFTAPFNSESTPATGSACAHRKERTQRMKSKTAKALARDYAAQKLRKQFQGILESASTGDLYSLAEIFVIFESAGKGQDGDLLDAFGQFSAEARA